MTGQERAHTQHSLYSWIFTSVGTTRGQGPIIVDVVVVVVVVATFSDILLFWKILKVNKALPNTDLLSLVMSIFDP